MDKKVLALLSTDGCHLCEEAQTLLNSMNVLYEYIDIIESDELVAHYGDKIPVLMFEGTEQALFWPFSIEQIKQYVDYYGISSTQ